MAQNNGFFDAVAFEVDHVGSWSNSLGTWLTRMAIHHVDTTEPLEECYVISNGTNGHQAKTLNNHLYME